ncbi:MAG: UDP-N-acetylmuramoyl-L-alanine--D-glutamate ligase [Marinisporobacter sp.]|nr:UDP-N-acetylmuramoyl-L-alanine--D-glutamate ligase [Marinisporobacter sp.]
MILEDKNVLVVGLGRSGIPTVETLLSLGAKVTVNDMKSKDALKDILKDLDVDQIELILGEHPTNLSEFHIMVLSPGVPTDLPFIKKAKKMEILVIGELELAYRLCKGKFIAITGTNGKTTTTALTGEIFKRAQRETYVVGNIGVAAVSKALEASEEAIMITEVSSFQLESTIAFKPKISAILNITPDHLNRHKTMENYIKAKANVFKNQGKEDYVVLNVDNELASNLKQDVKANVIPFSRKIALEKGVYVADGSIVVKNDEKEERICLVGDLKIPGKHNLENALAAIAISYFAGIDPHVIGDALKNFMGVEHRIEFVDEVKGVRFINDSKGTNPNAAIKAIEAMKTPIVLLAGGMDKGSDFKEFIHAFNEKVKELILIGETAQKIKKTAEENGFYSCTIVENLEKAVKIAAEVSKTGDTVLLSPACASWDMYPSFEVRGNHFKECVKMLRG